MRLKSDKKMKLCLDNADKHIKNLIDLRDVLSGEERDLNLAEALVSLNYAVLAIAYFRDMFKEEKDD